MPHVELRGVPDLEGFHARFLPRTLQERDLVMKATGCFLAHDRRSALVECLTVEGFLRQSFFVLLTLRADGVMVRLFARNTPEKTEGVKRCLVWVASWLRAGAPQSTIGATNLPDLLGIPFPPDSVSR